jgi:hypothetical protein
MNQNKPNYVAVEKAGDGFVAYHLDCHGEFDVDRIAFGHGITKLEAIDDLRKKTKPCA